LLNVNQLGRKLHFPALEGANPVPWPKLDNKEPRWLRIQENPKVEVIPTDWKSRLDFWSSFNFKEFQPSIATAREIKDEL